MQIHEKRFLMSAGAVERVVKPNSRKSGRGEECIQKEIKQVISYLEYPFDEYMQWHGTNT